MCLTMAVDICLVCDLIQNVENVQEISKSLAILHQHNKNLQKSTKFQCDFCGKWFDETDILDSHVLEFHEADALEQNISYVANLNKKTHSSCETCKKTFDTKIQQISHEKLEHGAYGSVDIQPIGKMQNPIPTSESIKIVNGRGFLQQPQKNAEKTQFSQEAIKIKMYPKNYVPKNEAVEEEDEEEEEEINTIRCKHCLKGFKENRHLEQHLKTVHKRPA